MRARFLPFSIATLLLLILDITHSSSQLSNEIACLSIAHSHLSPDPLLSVGLWTSQTVLLFSLPTLSPLLTQIIDTEYLIRSIVVVDLGDDATYLFAGLGDGRLTSYVIGQSEDGFAVEKNSKKTVVLGTRPIVMAVFEAEEGGSKSIFVSSDRPTVVSRKSDRLVYSSVNLKVSSLAVPELDEVTDGSAFVKKHRKSTLSLPSRHPFILPLSLLFLPLDCKLEEYARFSMLIFVPSHSRKMNRDESLTMRNRNHSEWCAHGGM